MSNRRIAKYSFYLNDYTGEMSARDENGQLVTPDEIEALVARLRDHPLKQYEANQTELDLIASNPDSIWRGAGYVYLLQSAHGTFKIGHTRNLKTRITTLRRQFDFKFDLIHVIKSNSRYDAERVLHNRFADKRILGTEWFHLTTEDVQQIKSISVL